MKYFKNKEGEVFAFEQDGSQDKFIKKDMEAMSESDIEDHFKKSIKEETYVEKRRSLYPEIGEQLDSIWKTLKKFKEDGVEIPDEGLKMIEKINGVKEKHPKK